MPLISFRSRKAQLDEETCDLSSGGVATFEFASRNWDSLRIPDARSKLEALF
jgi:hypothetical protein